MRFIVLTNIQVSNETNTVTKRESLSVTPLTLRKKSVIRVNAKNFNRVEGLLCALSNLILFLLGVLKHLTHVIQVNFTL
jgi:hypothetical protein